MRVCVQFALMRGHREFSTSQHCQIWRNLPGAIYPGPRTIVIHSLAIPDGRSPVHSPSNVRIWRYVDRKNGPAGTIDSPARRSNWRTGVDPADLLLIVPNSEFEANLALRLLSSRLVGAGAAIAHDPASSRLILLKLGHYDDRYRSETGEERASARGPDVLYRRRG